MTIPNHQTLTYRITTLSTAVLLASSLAACSVFTKTSKPTVNKPAPLVKLSSNQAVISPVFNAPLSSRNSLHHFSPFGRGKKQTITQSNNSFNAVVDEQGYVTASPDGRVLALDSQGRKLWENRLKQGLLSGVAADRQGAMVVVSDENANLIALDRATGRQQWKTPLTSTVLAPALITNNRIIALSNNGVINGISLQTGQIIWQFSTQNPALSVRGSAMPILLDDNTAIISTADGRIHALNLTTGVPLWSRRISNSQGVSEIERLADIDATPVLSGNMLYVISYSGQLVAFDMQAQQLSFVKDYASLKSVAVDGSQVYVTTIDGKVAALDKFTGNENWQSDSLRYRGLSNPITTDSALLVGDALGFIHALDKASGQVIGRAQARHDVSTLRVANGRVVAQSNNGGFSVWQVNR